MKAQHEVLGSTNRNPESVSTDDTTTRGRKPERV